MDEHIYFLKTSCRLCGNQVKGKSDVADKQSFKLELWLRFQINVDVDNDEIHPGGAGSPSHNALRINYIINCQLSRDPLVVSSIHGVKSTVS